MEKVSILSKKSVFFLLATFFGASYSAESPVDECFRIKIKDSAMLGQVVDQKSDEKRVLVVLHWPNEGLSFCRKKINGNERLLDVYFWEHIPRELEEDINREEFVTRYVKGYFYPSSFKLVIFPRMGMFSAHCGVAVLNENDALEYAAFPSLINQVLISILRKEFFYKRIVYFSGTALVKYLKKDALYQELEDDYRELYSPVQEFTSRVLGSPPHPIASKGLFPSSSPERERSEYLNARPPDDLGSGPHLGGIRSRLKLFRLHGAGLPLEHYPKLNP